MQYSQLVLSGTEVYQKVEQVQPKTSMKAAIKKLVCEEENRKWNKKLQTLQL